MSYIGNVPTTAAFLTDTFSGNGSTTAFTMSIAPATTSSVLVSITGVLQSPDTYSVSGTTLTFSAAPPSGTNNISARYLGIPASGVTTTAYRTVTNTTATAGQTSFTIPSYTVGYVDVYRNGVYLPTSDYTASTGTTVVLNNAATAGDTITTVSFYVSSVLNAIPATAGSVSTSYLVDASVTQAKLSTNVAGNGPAFSAYQGTNQTGIAVATSTKILFDSEYFDTNNNFASSRFTPTVAGYYSICATVTNGGSVWSNGYMTVTLRKNAVDFKVSTNQPNNGNWASTNISSIVYLNGSTDYVEIFATCAGISSSWSTPAAGAYNFFEGALIRAA